MDDRRTSAIVWGALLILVGVALLALQVLGAPDWFNPERSWPLVIVGVAALLAVIGLLTRQPGMSVPACIVGGIGLLLYYQNATGNWESWAYAWSLIPGFAGIGIILAGLFGNRLRGSLVAGLWLLVVSGVMFVIFGSFLGPLGRFGLARYWPLAIIALGLVMLIESLVSRRPGTAIDDQKTPDERRVLTDRAR